MVRSIVLFDCGGKLVASLFASRRSAFKLVRVDDQMGMIAVTVSCTEEFDPSQDYLLRQVSKNGKLENQVVFGALPKWAGGELLSSRCLLASGDESKRLLDTYPANNWVDAETRRHNGVANCRKLDDELNDGCFGK